VRDPGGDGGSLGLNNNNFLFFATIEVHCRTRGEKKKERERGKKPCWVEGKVQRFNSKNTALEYTRWQVAILQNSRTGFLAPPLSLIPQGTAIPQQKTYCYVSFYHTFIGEQTS